MKKLPNKVSTEDLLAALENNEVDNTEVDEIFDFRNDVPLFMAKYGIEAGEHKVSKRALYSLYLQFSESKVDKQTFGHAITQFVDFTNKVYFINKTRAEITTLLHKKNAKPSRYNISSVGTRNHFQAFIEENNIAEGNKWVESYILYYIYKKWCREHRKLIRFKERTFTSMLNLMMKTKRTANYNCWVKVEQKLVENLTDLDIKNITEERREKYAEYRKNKEKQKKRS